MRSFHYLAQTSRKESDLSHQLGYTNCLPRRASQYFRQCEQSSFHCQSVLSRDAQHGSHVRPSHAWAQEPLPAFCEICCATRSSRTRSNRRLWRRQSPGSQCKPVSLLAPLNPSMLHSVLTDLVDSGNAKRRRYARHTLIYPYRGRNSPDQHIRKRIVHHLLGQLLQHGARTPDMCLPVGHRTTPMSFHFYCTIFAYYVHRG
jgi:hypothetical protein